MIDKRPLIILTFLFIGSCGTKEKKDKKPQFTVQGDTVIVASNSDLAHKLKTETLVSQPYRQKMMTQGIVKAIPNFYAEIAPPFSGRISKSYLKLGMKVSQGSPLFEINCPNFTEIQKLFFESQSELRRAGLNLKRQKDLIKNGVGIERDFEEAESQYNVLRNEYENNLAGLKIFNVDPEKLSFGQTLIIRSPIEGEVFDNQVISGHYYKEGDPALAIIANLSKVWITGKVKEKDIRFIKEGDECKIEIAALPEKEIKGKVYHISKSVDENTRSVDVYIEVDNKHEGLKKGMYATINFYTQYAKVMMIPTKALFIMNDESFVFIETEPLKYVRQKIITAGNDNVSGKVVVQSGLKIGDKIIDEGGYFLMQVK